MKFTGSITRSGMVGNGLLAGLPSPDYENLSPSAGEDTPSGFSDSFGTYMLEFTGNLATSDNGIIIEIGDGGNSNRFFQQRRSSGSIMRSYLTDTTWGTSYIDVSRTAYPNLSTTNRIVLSWGTHGFWVYLNGAPIYEINGAMTRSTWDSIFIGEGNSGASSSTVGLVKTQAWTSSELTRAQVAEIAGDVDMKSGVVLDSAKKGIAFIGQSNSSGRASGSPSYTNTSLMKKVDNSFSMIANYSDPYDDDASSVLSELNDSTANVGYAGYVIDDLADDGNTYVAIPANKGSTSFEATNPHWDMFVSTSGSATGMAKVAISAFMACKIASQFCPIEGFVWGQGESDIVGSTSEADYETQLTKLVEVFQQGIANKKFVLAGFPEHNASWSPSQAVWDGINDAQVDVAASLSNCVFVEGTDIAGASGDEAHYDLAGYATVGGLIAASL